MDSIKARLAAADGLIRHAAILSILQERDMQAAVRQYFLGLERGKAAILADAEGWPEEELARKPGAGRWSMLEVLDHLDRTEWAMLEEMARNRERGLGVPVSERWMALVVAAVMLAPTRVKVPKGVDHVLPQCEPLAKLRARWGEHREELSAFLEHLAPEEMRFGMVRHPVSGWLTPKQAVRFLWAHQRHHCHQLARLRRDAGGRRRPAALR